MKRMKQMTVILVAIVSCLSLAACNTQRPLGSLKDTLSRKSTDEVAYSLIEPLELPNYVSASYSPAVDPELLFDKNNLKYIIKGKIITAQEIEIKLDLENSIPRSVYGTMLDIEVEETLYGKPDRIIRVYASQSSHETFDLGFLFEEGQTCFFFVNTISEEIRKRDPAKIYQISDYTVGYTWGMFLVEGENVFFWDGWNDIDGAKKADIPVPSERMGNELATRIEYCGIHTFRESLMKLIDKYMTKDFAANPVKEESEVPAE